MINTEQLEKFKVAFIKRQKLNNQCVRFDYKDQALIDFIDCNLDKEVYKINEMVYTLNFEVDFSLSDVVVFTRIDNLEITTLF